MRTDLHPGCEDRVEGMGGQMGRWKIGTDYEDEDEDEDDLCAGYYHDYD